MQSYRIPYGQDAQVLHLPENRLKAVLTPEPPIHTLMAEEEIVQYALEHPVGTKRLSFLARGKKRIVLVTSDHTRAMPSRLTLPLLLQEIRRGNPEAQITILIATGLHRPTTETEMRRMFGDAIVDHEKIAINRAFNKDEFVSVCILPSGASFEVNRLAAEADLLIAEGFVEPHFFAGFSGGRKSILPGICSSVTVNENHSYRAIASPCARTGVLHGNPIHEDMVYAARRVGLAFILNVALNEEKRIIGAFAGDMEQAHEAAVDFVRSGAECERVMGDIVITGNGGLPLDQNLYQAPKAVATAESCVRSGGVIIMCASCTEGLGGENFGRLLVSGTPEELDHRLSTIPPQETISEQWCVQIFSRILQKSTVILVTDGIDDNTVRRANMIPAGSVDEALKMALSIKGEDAEIVLIPDGVAVMIK